MDILDNIQEYVSKYIQFYGERPELVIGESTLEDLIGSAGIFEYNSKVNNFEECAIKICGCKFEKGNFFWGFYLKPFDKIEILCGSIGKENILDYKEIITIPCKIINQFPESEIDDIINTLIDHFYKNGFPYYPIDDKKIEKEYLYLLNYNVDDLEIENGNLQQNMMCLNTVNSFHPEMWSVKCKNAKTPMEVFQDRKLFKIALRKRIKYSDTKLADYNIRKSLKAFGAQGVSNFRPTIAKWVYQKFLPEGGKILDPCMGYGGRLMGAFCSHASKYVGVDPNEVTIKNNLNLYEHLKKASKNNSCLEFSACALPFEDFDTNEKFDLVFTSPPYFNLEKYSDNKNQSYLRYPNYKEWVESFLKVLIDKSYKLLNGKGYFAINVSNPIDVDTLNLGNEIFKNIPEIYYMRLSKILGQGNKNNISHKTEPIFVWQKIT